MIKTDLIILGGGLTGLTLHYLLRNENLNVTIIEARNRLGGRIHTVHHNGDPPVEMGATWLGPDHTYLQALLKELNIGLFQQVLGSTAIYEPNSMSPHQLVTLPQNQQPSYRVKGGTSTLIETLASYTDPKNVFTDHRAESITEGESGLLVQCGEAAFETDLVVSTLPPKLFQQTVDIHPDLPDDLRAVLSKTQTWMGESIKFGLTYEKPFWRDDDKSGTVFSNVGPVTEMYDHSNDKDNLYALKGFLNGNYFSLNREDRKERVLTQLRKYYGGEADTYLHYHEAVWAKEECTYTPYDEHVLPHQNNGHPMYQKPWLNGKLYIAGAETSTISPGYMDGAAHSAQTIYEMIKSS
jgi:monoamine oxidase